MNPDSFPRAKVTDISRFLGGEGCWMGFGGLGMGGMEDWRGGWESLFMFVSFAQGKRSEFIIP